MLSHKNEFHSYNILITIVAYNDNIIVYIGKNKSGV